MDIKVREKQDWIKYKAPKEIKEIIKGNNNEKKRMVKKRK